MLEEAHAQVGDEAADEDVGHQNAGALAHVQIVQAQTVDCRCGGGAGQVGDRDKGRAARCTGGCVFGTEQKVRACRVLS